MLLYPGCCAQVLLTLHLCLRFEELTNLIKTIRNAMKIKDIAKCLEEFEQLCRAFLKSKAIVDKEGVPQFYIRLLADLEDYLNQVCMKHPHVVTSVFFSLVANWHFTANLEIFAQFLIKSCELRRNIVRFFAKLLL